jgi:secondary thiamine-phosphate synthase enzyme
MQRKIFHLEVRSTSKEQLIDITSEVSDILRSSDVASGECLVFVPHTTAGVTINENADPDVKVDILRGLRVMVPENIDYGHVEGNSPAHIKTSIVGNHAIIPVENGKMLLGVWQGIYFCEFDGPRARKVRVSI